MAEVKIDESTTTDRTQTAGKECTVGRYMTEAEGWKVIAAASGWEGTPYRLVGAASEKKLKGDCSGTTFKIFKEAGFPYPYQMSSSFADFATKTNRFRKLDLSKTPPQAGDVLLWPGHMAIYAPFPENDPRRNTGVMKGGKPKNNNMYTAFNDRTGQAYGPYNIETFRGDAYSAWRYYFLPGDANC